MLKQKRRHQKKVLKIIGTYDQNSATIYTGPGKFKVRVAARNEGETISDYSDEKFIEVTGELEPIVDSDAEKNVTVKKVTGVRTFVEGTEVKIAWNPIDEAAEYEIEQINYGATEEKYETSKTVSRSKTNSITINVASPNNILKIKIRAIDSEGNPITDYSDEKAVKIKNDIIKDLSYIVEIDLSIHAIGNTAILEWQEARWR